MTSAAATAATAATAEKLPTVIPRDRLEEKEISTGVVMRLTLPGDETITEGQQSIQQFGEIGEHLNRGQWIEIENDAGSFWALMRVSTIHGTRSTGCRGLTLQNVVPPRSFDRQYEQPVATGLWYARHLGPHQKWGVISPTGSVFLSGLMSESEAQGHVIGKMQSSRPL
jgi:hypothetical protein